MAVESEMNDTSVLIEALQNQQQCDEDGIMCIVSRQAVCEAIQRISELEELAHYALDQFANVDLTHTDYRVELAHRAARLMGETPK
jgi:hypothetical protein